MLVSSYTPFQIKLGVVPEHFTSPIYQADAENVFKNKNIDLEVINCPCGTGDMLAKLASGELDVAIVVTEGFVAAKLKGDSDYLAIGTYVESPLCWAASTGANKPFQTLADLSTSPTFGISRFGSGSEIMAYYFAQKNNLDSKVLKFKVLGNLAGLSEGVSLNDADLFLWEKFTTKPLYDSGVLRYIGEVVAPWPSFTIVTHKKAISSINYNLFMETLDSCVSKFVSEPKKAQEFVVNYFKYSPEDVESWWSGVRYPKRLQELSLSAMTTCAKILNTSSVSYTDEIVKEWGLDNVSEWST